MTRTTSRIVPLFVALVIASFACIGLVRASEIDGTLSSDGSASMAQPTVEENSAFMSIEERLEAGAGGNVIAGSVIGGATSTLVEERSAVPSGSTMPSAAGLLSWPLWAWIVPLALLGIGAASYFAFFSERQRI